MERSHGREGIFYSWKVCMRHDLPTIWRSPVLALALSHYFLSLKH